ncbi:hypothetical protein [Panacibacter ginsenosidivorans]|nr:hypothetical protein [Panacibacter ginsenosidivorans]
MQQQDSYLFYFAAKCIFYNKTKSNFGINVRECEYFAKANTNVGGNYMRLANFIVFFFVVFSCEQTNTLSIKTKQKIKLTFEVIPEDYDKNLFYVEWTDTLGQGKGYSIIKRPEELQCIIKNRQQDTLGYYIGLSTPQTFAFFQTTDTIITINFKIGINIFSEVFYSNDNIRREYLKKDSVPKELEPITINIKTDLRKKITVVLTEN